MEVARLAATATVPPDFHVVYLGSAAHRMATLEALRNRHVLTVADAPWGQAAGVVLSFVEDDGRIRFDASLKAAEQAGIKLSARLLGVARKVIESTP